MSERRLSIPVKRLPGSEDLDLPTAASDGAAGLDVRAAVREDLVLAPGARALVPTGIALAVPAGHEVQVRPRSGLALRHGVTCLNSPGTIDSDYRGEVGVLLINLGQEPVTVRRGDRIAQLVVATITPAELTPVVELPTSERGEGGFGSTGR